MCLVILLGRLLLKRLVANLFGALNNLEITNGIHSVITDFIAISSALSVLMLIIGGYFYITSSGNPNKILTAKKIIKNTFLGLVIVLAAGMLVNFLGTILPSAHNASSETLNIGKVTPIKHDSGIVGLIIKAISGVFTDIITTLTAPFMHAFSFFISSTPIPSKNQDVFNLWKLSTSIADSLFIIVLTLLGMRLMSSSVLGLGEISFSKILSRSALAFIAINTSIYLIDLTVYVSNLMIKALDLNQANNVFTTLEKITNQPSIYSLAALIILVIFLVIAVILLIYYIGRIITIYLGAILSPLVILLFLLPASKDIAINLTRKYFTNIFVLFIHVIILLLASALLGGMGGDGADPLMSMLLGIATLIMLLKTQGVLAQISYLSSAPKIARQFSNNLVSGVSYIGGQAMQLANMSVAYRGAVNLGKEFIGSDASTSQYLSAKLIHQKADQIRNGQRENKYDEKGHIKK